MKIVSKIYSSSVRIGLKTTVLLSSISMILTACGKDGKVGPAGSAGAKGATGNANVFVQNVTVQPKDWKKVSDNFYSVEFTPKIATGGVQIYYQEDYPSDGYFLSVPYTLGSVREVTYTFLPSTSAKVPGKIDLFLLSLDGEDPTKGFPENFRIVSYSGITTSALNQHADLYGIPHVSN